MSAVSIAELAACTAVAGAATAADACRSCTLLAGGTAVMLMLAAARIDHSGVVEKEERGRCLVEEELISRIQLLGDQARSEVKQGPEESHGFSVMGRTTCHRTRCNALTLTPRISLRS